MQMGNKNTNVICSSILKDLQKCLPWNLQKRPHSIFLVLNFTKIPSNNVNFMWLKESILCLMILYTMHKNSDIFSIFRVFAWIWLVWGVSWFIIPFFLFFIGLGGGWQKDDKDIWPNFFLFRISMFFQYGKKLITKQILFYEKGYWQKMVNNWGNGICGGKNIVPTTK